MPYSVPQGPDCLQTGLTNKRQQEDLGAKDKKSEVKKSSPLSLLWSEYLCSPKCHMLNVMVLQGEVLGHEPGAELSCMGLMFLSQTPTR